MDTEQRVLKTLQLFALQHTAVTLLELWRFLVRDGEELAVSLGGKGELLDLPELENRQVTIAAIRRSLQKLLLHGEAVEHFGYYTTVEHRALLQQRWLGYQSGVWREKRIRRYALFFKYIPFVRGVALAGSQALGLQKKDSDIDLFIITAPGWLWLPRTLVTGYLQLFGVRRHGTKTVNRFCLNHYVSGPKKLHTGRNWYTALEYGKLRTLFGRETMADFQTRNLQWLNAFYPNVDTRHYHKTTQPFTQRALELLCNNFFGKGLERFLGHIQKTRIHTDQEYVIVETDELSFHPNSKQDNLLEHFS